jgi:hypothetical protein
MKQIRHLIAIVFLLCGLTAWGSDRGYDYDDMVVSTECAEACRHFGKWEVKDELVILHFDKQEEHVVQFQSQPHSELDKYVMKELEIL